VLDVIAMHERWRPPAMVTALRYSNEPLTKAGKKLTYSPTRHALFTGSRLTAGELHKTAIPDLYRRQYGGSVLGLTGSTV